MACASMLRPGQSIVDRGIEVESALKKLEQALAAGLVAVKVAPNGVLQFASWSDADRRGLTDACTYRALTTQGSWAFRQAVARAETLAGRKVDQGAMAAGTHTHTNGLTWSGGH